MPIDFTLTDGYLTVRMYGVITAGDFVHYAQDSEAFELQQPQSLDRITDLTAVESFDLHYDDVFQLAEHRRRQHHTRPVKSAIIAWKPVQIGMARMFQTVGDDDFFQIHVVQSLTEALNWLGATPPPATTS